MDKIYLIDSSSLLSLVRYYLFFDDGERQLFGHIKEQFDSEKILLLESVYQVLSMLGAITQ